MKLDTKCLAVSQALSVDADGNLRPCCKIPGRSEFNIINTDSIQKYKNSSWLKQLKDTMDQGQWPDECKVCRDQEQQLGTSTRLYVNEKLNYTESDKFEYLDLVLGNACNSECAMCDSSYSNKIALRINKTKTLDVFPVGLVNEIPQEKYKNKWFNQPEFFEWFKQQAPNLKIIKFLGGETFLLENLHIWLQWTIDAGHAKNIILFFNTNASILNQELMFNCVKNFKYVVMNTSVDGVDDCFNYIRHGLSWDIVKTNLLEYKKYRQAFANKFWVSLFCVVQVYNLKYLIDLLTWAKENDFDLTWLYVENMPFLVIKNIVDKQHIQETIEQLTNYKQQAPKQTTILNELINYLTTCLETNSYPAENFVSYTNYMNSFRTLKFNIETLEIQ
jgi:radical SAM protein with 4Fe4S-binding SPASM domain